jgi:polyphosphate kinase
VVFGVVGFKCHAKMLLIVRREAAEGTGRKVLRMYAHLGTGNYHARTARLYTDFGLMTANPEICEDARRVFLQITGSSQAQELRRLWQAPFTLHANVLAAIAREAHHARSGKPARVWARINALLEPTVIEALYAASQAGVEVRLLVRGACMLRPGVEGLSDNIRVRSTIGRFLEHSRVFYFHNGGEAEVYISSADWMERNLLRRVEIAVPLLDNKIKAQVIREGLRMQWQHPGNAWEMDSEGNYHRPRGSRSRLSCHQVLMHSRLERKN